jgi:small subunit ribosomal protein S14
MAKKSLTERNKKRIRMAERYRDRREALKKAADDVSRPPEERFAARITLAELPRNSSATRVRLRCNLTGRPRGNYQKFGLSRIALRELASSGQIPGMVKSSW